MHLPAASTLTGAENWLAAPITVAGGRIQGVRSDGVSLFASIPYAAPPVGELRCPPAPIPSWGEAVRLADRLPPACPQVEIPADSLFAPGVRERSEDCLYLNVWTAANRPDERRPVMVWLHGGGFIQGSSGVAMDDGAALARRGLVFVSVNYRLGALGFLAHPELSAESAHGAWGNYGLLDQIAALDWVRRNIGRFGGDPNNVTVAGQSAGSMALNPLTVSPIASRLFHKGIGQTGASMALLSPRPRAETEARGVFFAHSLGALKLEELRSIGADRIVAAAGTELGAFEPIVDGWVIPAAPEQIYRQDRQNNVPLLIGSNADEN